MGVRYGVRARPPVPVEKLVPPGNIGSQPAGGKGKAKALGKRMVDDAGALEGNSKRSKGDVRVSARDVVFGDRVGHLSRGGDSMVGATGTEEVPMDPAVADAAADLAVEAFNDIAAPTRAGLSEEDRRALTACANMLGLEGPDFSVRGAGVPVTGMASAFDFDDDTVTCYLDSGVPAHELAETAAAGTLVSLTAPRLDGGGVVGSSGLSAREKAVEASELLPADEAAVGGNQIELGHNSEHEEPILNNPCKEAARPSCAQSRSAGADGDDFIFDATTFQRDCEEFNAIDLGLNVSSLGLKMMIGLRSLQRKLEDGDAGDKAELAELRSEVIALRRDKDKIAGESGVLERSLALTVKQKEDAEGKVSVLEAASKRQEQALEGLRKTIEDDADVVLGLRNQLKSQELVMLRKDKEIADLQKRLERADKAAEESNSFFWQQGLHSFNSCRSALQRFGAEPQELPREMTMEHFFHWLDTEFKMLPDILSKVGDYAASVSADALLRFLEGEGCEHLKRLGSRDFVYPDCTDLPPCSSVCEAVKKIFLRRFWLSSGREFARKSAHERLTRSKEALESQGGVATSASGGLPPRPSRGGRGSAADAKVGEAASRGSGAEGEAQKDRPDEV